MMQQEIISKSPADALHPLRFSLPVMETFYSIQGEGFHTGAPAFFIRLGGCEVGCHWCDVKESWDAETHPRRYVEELILSLKDITSQKGNVKIIITGGEPLMYDLTDLTREIKRHFSPLGAGVALHLETSGAYPLTGEWDWICLSPKKFKAPLPEIYSKANELKVIIHNKDDFRFAEEMAKKMDDVKRITVNGIPIAIGTSTINHQPSTIPFYLQPEWSRREQMLPLMVEYVKHNPKWKISLQTHKYIGVP